MKIKNIHDFQDIVISALRYALGRRTYVTQATADFIKEYPEIIDDRVKRVMLNDLNEYFNMRDNSYTFDDKCDYNTWLNLKRWLDER